ncbi:hypothetical protein LUZ60_015649 [Juncus effusus]|nr:hypothetical protein LUZ60_015649 [Juncus effusus]
MMGKSQKLSKGRPIGFIPDYRHAVETVGESEVFASPAHIDSEDSCVPNPNPKSATLNPEKSKGFNVPLQFFSLSKLSLSERNSLQTQLRGELERVRSVQKRVQTRPVTQNSTHKTPKLDRPNPNPPKSLKSAPAQIPVPVPKPQISTSNHLMLMKQCEQLLKRLMTHQYSWVFNTPVDVIKLNIPDYFTVIKTPMDLGTVKNKLRTGQYHDPLGFVSDVRLTFQNAMTYNPKGNDVHTMADVMAKFFEARWKPIEKKIGLDRPVVQPTQDIVSKNSNKTPKSAKTGGNKTGVLPKKRKAEVAIERREEREREPEREKEQEREKVELVNVNLSSKRRMSDEQKIGLSRRLESIVAELPEYIIDFLKRNISSEGQNGDDEIEIDIDSLSDDTLFELEGLLDEFMREKEKQTQQDQAKNDQYENLNESGLSNSSMHEAKGQELVEEVDIGMDPPVRRSSPVVIEKETKCETSSSSSGSSASTSHDSDSSSSSGSGSDAKASSPPMNGNKDTASSEREKKSSIESKQPETESEAQLDGDKQYRAALLKGRFADTILKAREKTLDQGAKKDPEKLRREKEELERLKREAKVRLEAEAKAAEAAKKQAEAEEAMRKRAQEREAARQALQQMEQTVEINEGNLFMKGDEEIIGSGFNPGSNPLEQLGLFMKEDEEEEEDDEEESPQNNINNDISNIISNMKVDEVEEGEID